MNVREKPTGLPERCIASVSSATGDAVLGARPVHGGDINEAFELSHARGGRTFLKLQRGAPAGFFEAEARGLEWLRVADALRVPRVLDVGRDGSLAWLALEWVSLGRSTRASDERLGRDLATLHRAGAPTFGGTENNFIGTLAQDNAPAPTWPEFYRDRRLAPHVRALVDTGALGASDVRAFETLAGVLPDLFVDEADVPSRLHGDLWGGNAGVDEQGAPLLFDPAAYGGHREMDLGMMRLFGGFSERVFAAYHEAWPLPTGHAARVSVCQLYPLLVHARLFGGSYVEAVRRSLRDGAGTV